MIDVDATILPPWSARALLHVDLDAFFAAVEQLDHAEWRGRPVIVGGHSSRRGVVSTASYEARAFGVHSGMPSVRAASLCPDAVWAPPRFSRYKELSDAVFRIFEHHAALVQPVSVDEAFLDVTSGRYAGEHPVEIARRIRADVALLGLTASVGVATSKTVAKIASDHDKPDGLTVVWPGEEAQFLAPLPVRAMGGIGPRTTDRLQALGIHTLGSLAALDEMTARSVLGVDGLGYVLRAQGVDPSPVRDNEAVKSVSKERTFATDKRTVAEVEHELQDLVSRVCSRLRSKGVAGRTVTVKLRFGDFTTRTARKTLADSTNDETIVGEVALDLLRDTWSAGVGLRLLGVGVSGLSTPATQLDLFGADPAVTKVGRTGLVENIDAIRKRFGHDAVRFGTELTDRKGPER
ncbi:MAG: DNA polymerase IV [Coriobacteriia bacterium]|nr:DNA polymerase IV [Coriobacteriia bacterium]